MERRRADGVDVVDVGEVAVRVHRPSSGAGPHPGLVWIHGGGMVIGTAAQDDRLCRAFVEATGCVVAAVSYRLAPEHPFPAGLEDCYAALAWLHDPRTTGRRPRPDRDRRGQRRRGPGRGTGPPGSGAGRGSGRLPAAGVPDARRPDRPAHRHRREAPALLWNTRSNAFGWTAYLGRPLGGAEVSRPYAAPAGGRISPGSRRPGSGSATLDLFHDEDVAYAERLQAAGVECELDVVEGAFHGFDGMAPKAEVVRAFHTAQVEALRGAFASSVATERPVP